MSKVKRKSRWLSRHSDGRHFHVGLKPHLPPKKFKAKVSSLSGMGHTLSSDEYEMLDDLDRFAAMYNRQHADLPWLARSLQDRRDRLVQSSTRKTLLKNNIDDARDIMHKLWRKGLVDPHTLKLKTTNGVKIVVPKTKKEAFETRERWRISIKGSDLVNPPEPVASEIKRLIEKEEKETGKVTPMKAFQESWRKVERKGGKVPSISKIRQIRGKALSGKPLTKMDRETWEAFTIDQDKQSAVYAAKRTIADLGGDVTGAELVGGMRGEYQRLRKDFDVRVTVKDARLLKNKKFLDTELDSRKIDIFVEDKKGRKLFPIGISPQMTQLRSPRRFRKD